MHIGNFEKRLRRMESSVPEPQESPEIVLFLLKELQKIDTELWSMCTHLPLSEMIELLQPFPEIREKLADRLIEEGYARPPIIHNRS